MSKLSAIALNVASLAVVGAAKGAAPDLRSVRVPAGYRQARSKLLALGLKPAPLPAAFRRDESRMVTCGDICKTYPEVIHCAGTGLNPCRMAFVAPGGQIVLASTSGEEPQHLILTGVAYANKTDSAGVKNIMAGRPEM